MLERSFPLFVLKRVSDMIMVAFGFWAAKQLNNEWSGLLTMFIIYSLLIYPMFWLERKILPPRDEDQ